MTGLDDMLERLGLSQYLQVFLSEGFDSWETLMDITESDLETLHVKLGHRRKLQRAIIDARGRTTDNITLGAPQQLGPKDDVYRSGEESGTSARDQKKTVTSNTGSSGGQKRKYRRHPKLDEYAPERPPSAYVIFSNQMRDKLKGQELSFTEIAKIVGERWQVLSSHEKEPCERQAQAMKEKYYADLTEYKKTPEYSQYQGYLSDFRAKHNQQQDNKKLKLEHEAQRSNSQDHVSRTQNPSPSSPQNGYDQMQHDWHPSASPKAHVPMHLNSPLRDDKSPSSASPRISNFRRFPPGPASEDSTLSQDSRRPALPPSMQSMPNRLPGHNSNPHESESPNPGHGYSGLQDTAYSPPRRVLTKQDSLPSLMLEDTAKSTASSECSHAPSQWSHQVYNLPSIDSSKANTSRVLPIPLPLTGHMKGLINPRPLESTSSASRSQNKITNLVGGHDNRSKSSIVTLLRAGEHLDRDTARRKAVDGLDRGRVWERER